MSLNLFLPLFHVKALLELASFDNPYLLTQFKNSHEVAERELLPPLFSKVQRIALKSPPRIEKLSSSSLNLSTISFHNLDLSLLLVGT